MGVFLLLFVALATVYAIRDLSTLWTHRRIIDAEPHLAIGVLAATPWLGIVSWRLLVGRLERHDLMPPIAMMIFGIASAIGGYWGIRNGYVEVEGRTLWALVLVSVGSFVTGLHRWITRRRTRLKGAA
jgi:hypothetical protein